MRRHSQSFLLVRDPTSVPISRHRLQDLVKKWGLRLDESSDIALTVITSELVTNAVRHGTGTVLTITVSANLSRRRILVEVYDGSLVLPAPHWVDSEDESGRGSPTACPSATEPSTPPAANACGRRSPCPESESPVNGSFSAPDGPPELSPAVWAQPASL
ncbi:ATP-binding protein [Streptomyces sp. NPDC127097]|uniref:ATP-binding protein n=1 Tax=Streptomyces sp. NPDC127097 TaxID=3347136 RepID=UPI00365B1D1F